MKYASLFAQFIAKLVTAQARKRVENKTQFLHEEDLRKM